MPKRGSELVKFLRDALNGNKYNNLLWVNIDDQVFSLKCIHGGNKEWTKKGCKIFEDWKNKKKRRQTEKNEFSEGRQRLLAAMNKCKLLKKFKKESSVSVKYYQFIDGMNSDSEDASCEEISDRDTSPGPAEIRMENMESYTENMSNETATIASLSVSNFKFPEEIWGTMVENNLNVDMPISTENAIDPNFLDLQPVSSSDVSEVLDSKMNLFHDDYVQTKQETEYCNLEYSDVEHLVSLAENIAGAIGSCSDAVESNSDNSAVTANDIFPLDPISDDAIQAANNSEPTFPPVRLFRCGDYVIGITKVLHNFRPNIDCLNELSCI